MNLRYQMILLLLLFSLPVMAQQHLKGVVKDQKGRELPGIRIVKEGSRDTVYSGAKGQFDLIVAKFPVTLIISADSYIGKRLTIHHNDFQEITYQRASNELNEVKIKAIASAKKDDKKSYQIEEIQGLKLLNTFEPNPINALRGRVLGMQTTATAGGVTSGTGMVIRGMKSIVGGNQPLFVVDGMPIENETSGANQYGGQDWGNSLKELNAYDIASVSVLKSAAAVAQYGSRGLNGVIEITTKGAEARAGWQIEANMGYSMGRSFNRPELLSNEQIAGIPDTRLAWIGSSSKKYYESFQTAASQVANVAVSHGTDQHKIRVSYTADYNKGTYLRNTLDKNTIALKSVDEWSPYFSTTMGLSYNHSVARNAPGIGAQKFASLGRAFIEYPEYFSASNDMDPVESETAWHLYGQQARKNAETLRAYVQGKITLSPSLRIETQANFSDYRINSRENAYGYIERLLGTDALYHQEKAYRNNAKEYTKDWTGKIKGVYELAVREMKMDFFLGYDYWKTYGGIEGNAIRPGQPNPYRFNTGDELRAIQQFEGTEGWKQSAFFNIDNANQKQIHGTFAGLNLDWKGKLFFNSSLRMDQIKTIENPKQLGNLRYIYPSAGVAYFINDDLRKLLNQKMDWLSYLKLRANVGRTGNVTGLFHYQSNVTDDLELPYPSHKTLSKPYYTSEGTWGLRNYQTGFSIENAWEWEIGLNTGLFNNKLNFAFTWYNRNTKNNMYDVVSPIRIGDKPLREVYAEVRNRGWEMQLTVVPFNARDFNWSSSINFAANRNRFLNVNASDGTNATLGGSQNDVSLMANLQGSFGTITSAYAHKYNAAGQPAFDAAMQYVPTGTPLKIGDASPQWIAGFENTFSYKGFSLSALLDAKIGGDIWSGSYALLYQRGALANTAFGRSRELGGQERTTKTLQYNPVTRQNEAVYHQSYDGIIPSGVFDDGVQLFGKNIGGMSFEQARELVGKDAEGQYLLQPLAASDYYAGFHDRAGVKDEAVFKNSYIALRELSIAYTLPAGFTRKLSAFSSSRIGLVGRNLGYLYKSLPYGLNPDGAYNNRSGGALEYASLLPVRTFGAFIQFTF